MGTLALARAAFCCACRSSFSHAATAAASGASWASIAALSATSADSVRRRMKMSGIGPPHFQAAKLTIAVAMDYPADMGYASDGEPTSEDMINLIDEVDQAAAQMADQEANRADIDSDIVIEDEEQVSLLAVCVNMLYF
ncbi:hypothetical protein Ndes2437B_g05134 [Nannochloris sp. 'desiccata']